MGYGIDYESMLGRIKRKTEAETRTCVETMTELSSGRARSQKTLSMELILRLQRNKQKRRDATNDDI